MQATTKHIRCDLNFAYYFSLEQALVATVSFVQDFQSPKTQISFG